MSKHELRIEILGTPAPIEPDAPGLPFYLSNIEAGFPSPADDFIDQSLNLHTYLVRHKEATFFVRAHGQSMIEAGILDGDILIVDRALPAEHNRIVIAALDNELTVKRLVKRASRTFLVPANNTFPEFEITNCEYFQIWGVVTYAIHTLI